MKMLSGKKGLAIIAAISLVVFGGSLIVSMTLNKPDEIVVIEDETPNDEVKLPNILAENSTMAAMEKLSMPEQKLTLLIQDYNQKSQAFKSKENQLISRGKRIDMVQQAMDEQINQIQAQIAKLDTATKRLRQERQDLKRDTIEFTKAEREGLKKSAAMLSSMDPEKAAATFTNLVKKNNIKDALVMLDMIPERKSGEILGLVDSETCVKLLESRKKLRASDG